MSLLEIEPLGDAAVVVRLGHRVDTLTHQRVQNAVTALETNRFMGMIECVPAYTSVTILYDPYMVWKHAKKFRGMDQITDLRMKGHFTAYDLVKSEIQKIVTAAEQIYTYKPRTIEIPVCYGGAHGPDLQYVAEYNGLTVTEVIQIHTSEDYLVYMIGFAPGFPYLGGMSERIATPRKATPRLSIPAGTVGIAGTQTGVYPFSTPGGWQLIGKTPVTLFDPVADPPSLLHAGDRVRFYSITESEFDGWSGDRA